MGYSCSGTQNQGVKTYLSWSSTSAQKWKGMNWSVVLLYPTENICLAQELEKFSCGFSCFLTEKPSSGVTIQEQIIRFWDIWSFNERILCDKWNVPAQLSILSVLALPSLLGRLKSWGTLGHSRSGNILSFTGVSWFTSDTVDMSHMHCVCEEWRSGK